MVLDLCLCSIFLIDEIIWIQICVVVFDPMIITILDLALCCVVSVSFFSWFFMANGSKEVVFCSRFNIIKALIWDESINWKVDLCIYSPWFVVDVLMTLKRNDQYVRVGVNTCGHFWCVWIIKFGQSLSSIFSIPKSRWINSFKDIDDVFWGKLNIISVKSMFVLDICWQWLHL